MDAVITGASTGIGRACAIRLDREGWRVFAGVRREHDAESLRAEAGPRLTPLILDVTDAGAIEAAAAQVADAVGPGGLHGLVNNAGIGVGGPLEFVAIDDLRRQLEVNVVGQVAVIQAFLPQIRATRGRIVNMSSVGGRTASPFLGPYTASKHAMEAVSDSLRIELRKWGIWVAIIEPGSIKTPIWEKAATEIAALMSSMSRQERELYGTDIEQVHKFAARLGARGASPHRVADAVWHALTARRPRSRYLVGIDARAQIAINGVLPARALDGVLARLMGLGR